MELSRRKWGAWTAKSKEAPVLSHPSTGFPILCYRSHLPHPGPSPDKGWSFPTAQIRSFQVLYPNPHELWGFPAWLLEEAIFPVSAVSVAIVVQSLSRVQLFAPQWLQASLSFTLSQGLLLLLLVCTSCSFPSHGWLPYTNVPVGTQQILKGTLWRSQGFLFFFFLSLAVPGLCCGMLIFIRGLRTLSCSMGDLVPWPGIEPRPCALAAWSLSHWPSREVLWWFFLPSAFPLWYSALWATVTLVSLDPHLEIINSGILPTLPGLPDWTRPYKLSQGKKLGWGFPGGSAVKRLPAMQEMQVRSLGGDDLLKNPLQYSCLKNPTDRGAWGYTTPHGVAKSQTRLSD